MTSSSMEKFLPLEVLGSKEEKPSEVSKIENRISIELPIDALAEILPPESYLIGGSVRDVILEKSVKYSDLDIYTRAKQAELISSLKSFGYIETSELPLKGRQYFFDENGQYVYFNLNDKRVEIKFIGNAKIEDLISLSDINLNCCAFDIGKRHIVNDDIAMSVKEKRLEFSNPKLAKDDIFKILSALKQIARLPDLEITEETEKIIRDGSGNIYEYFKANPKKRSVLKNLLCNINSGQILNYFSDEQKAIFQGLETKPSKMTVPEGYYSMNIHELSDKAYKRIKDFVKEVYGRRFDPLKSDSRKVNSVVFDEYDNGLIKSCCLFDGLRLYAVASRDQSDAVKTVRDIIVHNYSIWTTISASHKLLIKLSLEAGLKLEKDKVVIHKILSGQYSEYLNNTIFNERDGTITFKRSGSDNYEQVLLRI